TTIVLDSINTTPTGGAVPPAATATLTAPADPFYGPAGSTIDFPLQFVPSGAATRVYSTATAGPLTAADVTVGGTAGGTASYSLIPDGLGYIVRVGPLTSAGTVEVSVPAGTAVDAWAQPTLASVVASTEFIVPVPPSFTAAAPPAATVGAAYSYTFTAAGIPDPTFSLESGSLPAGMALASDGVLGGTPAAGSGGSYPLTVRAANAAGDVTAPVTLIVNQAPTITSAASASFLAGTFRSFTITTSGFPAPSISLARDLPPGLAFTDNGDGTGTISGSAAAS
ncbi:MAG: putative Ig domain-containing protein, partial [Actinomycetota bacterium]|nr:putative Ig domain-containing protein [Actinomycetota bacterium]